jgi:phospholipid/cholesterol/gamma-HCH transport system substrate-binding protein
VSVVESASRTVDRINEFVESVRPTVESINRQVPAVLENVESLTTDANDTVARVSEMLGPEARDRVQRILSNVDEASAEAASLVSELRESRRQADAMLRRVDELIARNEPGVDQSLADLQSSLASVSRRIDAMTYNLEATTRNMSEFSRQIRSNPGLILRGREAGEEPAGGGR